MCAGITAIQHERRRLHAVASCGSRCARAGAATRTAWPTSSLSSADKDGSRDRGRVVWPHRSLLGSAPRARAHAPQLEALGLWARRQARRSRADGSAALVLVLHCINTYKDGCSASEARQAVGEGRGAVVTGTHLAEAIHRLALWVGGLSTVGAICTLRQHSMEKYG